jgi:hypothetical protein
MSTKYPEPGDRAIVIRSSDLRLLGREVFVVQYFEPSMLEPASPWAGEPLVRQARQSHR